MCGTKFSGLCYGGLTLCWLLSPPCSGIYKFKSTSEFWQHGVSLWNRNIIFCSKYILLFLQLCSPFSSFKARLILYSLNFLCLAQKQPSISIWYLIVLELRNILYELLTSSIFPLTHFPGRINSVCKQSFQIWLPTLYRKDRPQE